jgi:glycosyltransferase involved in cell wall biosynthesis
VTAAGPRLGIDGGRLTGPASGVTRYLVELLRSFAELESPFSRVTVYVPNEPEAALQPDCRPLDVRVLPGRGDPGLWAHWTLARAASAADDLLFCPSYVAPLAYRGPFVVTIHDALPAFDPAANPSLRRRARIAAVRRSARRARLVLTPSESTKRDVERYYGVPPASVRAIPLAVADPFRLLPSAAEGLRVRGRHGLGDDPFVLFVGKLARRRNLPVLVEAFGDARTRLGFRHRLVIAGADSLGIGAGLAAAGGDAVCLTGQLPEEDLHVLYHEAELFVYPSSYEGFGLPVLEAMASGTAVVTIANSSLAEVAGDAALVIPEPTREALGDAIADLLADAARREELVERGRARAAQFSWRRTAEETLAALAEAAGVR